MSKAPTTAQRLTPAAATIETGTTDDGEGIGAAAVDLPPKPRFIPQPAPEPDSRRTRKVDLGRDRDAICAGCNNFVQVNENPEAMGECHAALPQCIIVPIGVNQESMQVAAKAVAAFPPVSPRNWCAKHVPIGADSDPEE